MNIKEIKINNYGNLENKEINLENGINIVYGKNESGKSTLLNYIKNIFYGISKNKNGRDISDYERYKPWGKEDFSGKLKYELDNKKEFEIYRDFNKKNPKIFNENLEEISKEFNIDKKDGSQFFYDQTKINETMFLSTVVSMQQEVKLDKQSQQVLVQKLANLAGTGDDNISFEKVIAKLNKRQVEEVGTERTQGKPINIVKDRMKQIELAIRDMNSSENEKTILEERERTLKEEINSLQLEKSINEQLESIYLKGNFEKEKIELKEKIKSENKTKIDKLNKEKEELIKSKEYIALKNDNNKSNNKNNQGKHEKSKKSGFNNIILLVIFVVIFAVLEVINIKLGNNVLNIAKYSLIPIYFAIVLIKMAVKSNKNKKIKYEDELNKKIEDEKSKNEITVINTKIDSLEKQINQLCEEQELQKNEISKAKEKLDNNIDEGIEQIREEYKNKIDIDKVLDDINEKYVSNKIKNIEEELGKKRILLNTTQIEEKSLSSKLENKIALEEEYKQLEEELRELEEKNNCINLTKEYLSKAYARMKNTVTPKFTKNLSETIDEISSGKYNMVTINDESGLIVENKLGEYIPVERLSVGTIDQLYLSLRLSMIDEISKENMPVILDEAFAFYDEGRLENILKFLIKRSEKNQVIIFTCTKREKTILDRLGVCYNLVEL